LRRTIVHVITELGSGGAERMLVRLVTGSTGFRHVVVTLTGDGELAAELRSAGVDVIPLGMRRGIPSVKSIVRLSRIIRRERPAVVQTWLYHADLSGLVAAKLARFQPVVWNLRCSNMDLSLYRWSTRAVVRLLTWLSAQPEAVMVNSEAGRRWHGALGYRPKRWELLPNGVDVTIFRPNPEARARWRRHLGIKQDDVLIGMVARRDPMKDHEGMLQAAAKAARLRPELAFVFAGRGVSRDDPVLARLADEVVAPVHLIDACDDVPGLMASLDVAVLSAAFGEGFPNVVAEAMAAGVPCVVTDVGDSAAIVDTTGLVVPPRNPLALAEAISALAADNQLRARLGASARRRVMEHFSLPAASARYEAAWERLAALETGSVDAALARGETIATGTVLEGGSPTPLPESQPADVSVVIPVYNRAHEITRSVLSALQQTHPPREVVVVDDASTDETCATVRALDDPRIRLIRHERNLGAAAARNTGVAATTGTWLAFLDSDDEWAPEKLARQLRRIVNGPPGVCACVTGYSIYDQRYRTFGHFRPSSEQCKLQSLVWGCSLSPGSTLVVRRQAFFDVGPFDARMTRFEDWDWLLRFCRDYVLISEPETLTIIHKATNPSLLRVESSLAILREKHRDAFYKISRVSGRRFDSSVLIEHAACAYYNRHYALMTFVLLRAMAIYPFRNAAFFRMLGRRMRFLLGRKNESLRSGLAAPHRSTQDETAE
jgi:glycosyltransferase involved in cell wall biosynthesis